MGRNVEGRGADDSGLVPGLRQVMPMRAGVGGLRHPKPTS